MRNGVSILFLHSSHKLPFPQNCLEEEAMSLWRLWFPSRGVLRILALVGTELAASAHTLERAGCASVPRWSKLRGLRVPEPPPHRRRMQSMILPLCTSGRRRRFTRTTRPQKAQTTKDKTTTPTDRGTHSERATMQPITSFLRSRRRKCASGPVEVSPFGHLN